MTVADARAIAGGARRLADAMESPRTPVKAHGAKKTGVDPVRYAWEALRAAPFPERLLGRYEPR